MKPNIQLLYLKPNKRKETEKEQKKNEWLDKFIEERLFDNIAETTLKTDIKRLNIFLNFCKKIGKEPDQLNKRDFINFFNYLENERKVSISTQDKYYKLLKVFYRLMRLNNYKEFAEECKERKRFSRFEAKPYDYITESQVDKILKEIGKSESRTKERDVLIIRFLWDTGARASEVLNLTYKDCDFQNGVFRLRNTKGKEERLVVCKGDTLQFLRWYIQYNIKQGDDDPIFQTNKGKKVKKDWISKVFRTAVKKLQNEGKLPRNKRIVLHSLRHGRIVKLLENGIELDVVKEYAGHKHVETTLRYAHTSERTVKNLERIKKI